MDKFHKYCLSVLLVIVCGNISGQTSNESIKNIDCKRFYEIYSQCLNDDFDASQEFYLEENSSCNFAINHKQNALDFIGKFILGKEQNKSCSKKLGADFSEKVKHSKLLQNFEKQSKQNDFSENIYFKSKVAKIRNKDDLDLKNKT